MNVIERWRFGVEDYGEAAEEVCAEPPGEAAEEACAEPPGEAAEWEWNWITNNVRIKEINLKDT